MTIICPNPKCKYHVYASDSQVLSEAAAISNSRRKTHGAGYNGGRPKGYRRCQKCEKFHQPEETCKA